MTDETNRVNEADLEWEERIHGDTYEMRRKRLGVHGGGDELGCSLYEIPPDRHFGPYHYHTANEEAIYVLEGDGSIRTPTDEFDITAGDYVTFPTGETGSHQIKNETENTLRYLCFSTMQDPDVVVYPDSNKYLIMSGGAPGRYDEERDISIIFQAGSEVGYWHDE